MVLIIDSTGKIKKAYLSSGIIDSSGGGGGVTSVTASFPITSSGGATPNISTSMNTNRLIGRSTAGLGVMEEISLGTGLSLAAGTLTNTAPDQTVVLTQGGTTTITGTYPNFTISSADQYTGTVTNFGFTNGSGFQGTVSTSTTTPTLSLGLQSNNNFVTDAEKTVLSNTSGINTGDQTTISGNAGTATTLQTSRQINTVNFNGSADINVDANKVTQSYLGGGCLVSDIQGFLTSSSGNALNNQQIIFIAKPLLKNETISGFKFRIQISGVFVGNNNNKAGAYELNPATGLLTKRAESANAETIWKQSTAILNTVSFVTPYAFTAGVIYFAFLYCRSSQTTAPSILRASANSPDQYAGVSLDFPNSIKLYGSLSSQTDLPATVNMSSIAVSTNNFWCQGF
jgi:hypothetical protein